MGRIATDFGTTGSSLCHRSGQRLGVDKCSRCTKYTAAKAWTSECAAMLYKSKQVVLCTVRLGHAAGSCLERGEAARVREIAQTNISPVYERMQEQEACLDCICAASAQDACWHRPCSERETPGSWAWQKADRKFRTE